jgi:hypothetical protein
MRMSFDASPLRQSRIRKKSNVPVELVLVDGTQFEGSVFIGLEERVQDLLNDPKAFFPLRLHNGDVLLLNKTSVALCRPLENTVHRDLRRSAPSTRVSDEGES